MPLLTGTRYIVTQTTLFFIWAIVVTQWNLVLGVGGIFSLAQMALFAVGAYATAMLGYYWHVPMLLAMPLAGLGDGAGERADRLGVPAVARTLCRPAHAGDRAGDVSAGRQRHRVLHQSRHRAACRCSAASAASRASAISASARCSGSKFYIGHFYVGLALLALATAFSIAIIRGPAGLAFQALRDNPAYAVSRGISRFKYQLWLFGLSAFFTGLAGAFYAVNFGAVGPIVFSISMLLFLVSMIVVGGIGTVWGPLLGAALLMLADEAMREVGRLARHRPRHHPGGLRDPAAQGVWRVSIFSALRWSRRPLAKADPKPAP